MKNYRLNPLEIAAQLPVGDTPVERLLLEAGRVQIVLDHVVAKGLPRNVAFLQRVDGFHQVARNAWQFFGVVRVTAELGRQLELVLDAVETGGDGRREREVRIRVGAGDPALDPQARTVTDDAEAARPVVPAPDDRGRSK